MFDDVFEGGFICGAAPDPIFGMVGFILRVDADEDSNILTYSHDGVVVTSISVESEGSDILGFLFTVVDFGGENTTIRNLGGLTACV
jgi:hypothetical protein